MELDRDVLRSLQRWLNQNRGDTDILLPLQAMTMLINRAYIGLCEYYGPVKADQILHDAVSLVAKTREGQLFNPEKLL